MSSVVLSGDTSGSITLSAPLVAGSNTVTLPAATGTIELVGRATAVSASGTSVDFTSIPSWVKRITVMFQGVSTSGTSNLGVQIGSGSVTTSGYTGFTNSFNSSPAGTSYTSSFLALELVAAGSVFSGIATLANVTGNTWVFSVAGGDSGNTAVTLGGGNLALGGTLDRVRITTTNGTDTFDAGTINIIYEG